MSRASSATRPPWRRRTLLATWLVAGALVCARAAQIQVVQGPTWRDIAEGQHTTDKTIAAARGTILDRDGVPLAVSREAYRVSVAPGELTDRTAVTTALADALELSPTAAARLTDERRRWRVAPGTHPPAVRERLSSVRGVYLERELQRFHPHGDLARGLLGVVIDGEGQGGVEQSFDEFLRGREGREVVARDNVGRPIPGETFVVDPPRSGGHVVLTVDMDLQEIAREALEEAIEENQARGGDVIVSDPHTGEILAMVSIRDGRAAALSAVNTPYEPGSTLKPFTVAGLLSHDLASLEDTVDVGDGTWAVEGRVLHDVHAEGVMSIGDALRVSSNVGVAKAARAMSPGQQYETLRDFGFGVPTGVRIPGEVAGTLRRPDSWSRQSAVSLAIGYEIAVTPIQMAMAYGALANGGVLMEPRLVAEVRDADGRTMERFPPREVRRVVEPEVAARVGRVLEDVVQDGTGTRAQLGTFRVAGKSGTSRAYGADGYEAGEYYSSFVGFFPAEDPQLVVFVKLERPRGASYYGGSVAAPVTRATMEAALAARTTPLDRDRLLRAARIETAEPNPQPVRFASLPMDPPAAVPERPVATTMGEPTPHITRLVSLPDVSGLPARVAVRRLHALGLRVVREVPGEIVDTRPAAGARVAPGDTIRLLTRRRTDG